MTLHFYYPVQKQYILEKSYKNYLKEKTEVKIQNILSLMRLH